VNKRALARIFENGVDNLTEVFFREDWLMLRKSEKSRREACGAAGPNTSKI
jgi:hypothetical protein